MSGKRKGDGDGPSKRATKQTRLNFVSSSRTEAKPAPRDQAHPASTPDDVRDGGPHGRHASPGAVEAAHPQADGAADQGLSMKASGPSAASALPKRPTIKVIDQIGDIFDAPRNAVIIHACNCIGHWGAGIAAAFKQRYPAAHRQHLAYCKDRSAGDLVGTAQLIPPCEAPGKNGKAASPHYVGCLFTSKRFGRNRDTPEQILAATGPAMKDLLDQIQAAVDSGKEVTEIRTCQINSGLFAVPWEKSRDVMQSIDAEGLDESLTTVVAYMKG